MDSSVSPTIVKLTGRTNLNHIARQLPSKDGVWGSCRFVLNRDARKYDWLVVYHDLPSSKGKRLSLEHLKCPKERTILITTEPSTITVYGTAYLKQFGTIITSQEPWVIRHPNTIFTQAGLMWFYGIPFDGGHILDYKDLKAIQPPNKTKMLSTMCSERKGFITLHSFRVAFTARLQKDLPETDVFGHGVRPVSDKAEILDPYLYHIAVENHVYPHHMTEKLPDAFLGYTLPFYHGCPNADEYFPSESFIPIDCNNYAKTLDIIKSTIKNNEYKDRLPYIIEARRRVLEEHNLFAVLERYISHVSHNAPAKQSNNKADSSNACIMNRTLFRIKKPLAGISTLLEKVEVKGQHLAYRIFEKFS
jgi:hypothetical protein